MEESYRGAWKTFVFYEIRFRSCWDSLDLIDQLGTDSIDLAITSPPFALQREKSYGNVAQEAYVNWLLEFCKKVYPVLAPTGSFVIDLGGAYQSKRPVRSLYNYHILIRLCEELDFRLAEEFFWFNPAKLPSPIEWVNKRKIRAKDAVNTVWWLSKGDYPKADIRRVLVSYSDRMKKLHRNPDKYTYITLLPVLSRGCIWYNQPIMSKGRARYGPFTGPGDSRTEGYQQRETIAFV